MVRKFIGVLGELLITAGVLVLLFVVWQLWWTDVAATREQTGAVASLERQFTATPVTPTAQPTTPVAAPPAPRRGEAFAILRVPRFGAGFARPVLEGTGQKVLAKGVGHYVGAAMPAGVGNFSVAGHRTTYGRPFHNIDKLRPGDALIVETKTDYHVYRVKRHVIVRPHRMDVLAPVPEKPGAAPTAAWMTLTACHPKFSAEFRYVVFAELDRTLPRSGGLPRSLLRVAGKVAT